MTNLKDKLIGTWKLIKYQDEDEQGNIFYPLGEDATDRKSVV